MDRSYSFELRGVQHKFFYTSAVMYDAMEKYEMDIGQIFDMAGKERVEAVIFLANAMTSAAGGTETFDSFDLTPVETLMLETAVIRAINAGNQREYKPKLVSKTLQKIQKKKVVRVQLARILFWLLFRVLGYRSKKHIKQRLESSTT